MTWKKRIISIALCLCALLCAASVRADAAEHSHPICGASHTDIGNHKEATCSNVTWTAWNGTDTIGNDFFKDSNTKYLYLSQDVEISDKWTNTIVPEGKTLYLCLNGHSLTRKASNYTINVYGTLVLCDCNGNGSGQGKGAISHGKEEDGSFCGTEGVYVTENATFTMYGGKICNNNGGVLVSGGTFTMYGGEISKNKRTALDTETITYSAEGGGGVWVKDYKSWSSGQTTLGNFAMYGGKISDNEVQSKIYGGGGVCMDSDGSFYMENGTITGNKCNNSGGGLDIRCKTITIKGNSTISGNTCGGEGGGIFAISSGESSITNCTISNNAATGKSSKGGGLAFQNSTFTLEKCTITGNKATGKGGGIFVLDNTANLTLSSGLNFSGNAQGYTADTATGSLTGGTANDVFLHTGAYLRLDSTFSRATSTAPIVVTTYFEPDAYGYKKIAEDNRTTPDPTDFKYGNDSNSTIGIIAKTRADGTTVELLACEHSYSTQKDETNHWQECSICKDKKDVTAHQYNQEKAETGCLKTAATCTDRAVYYKSCVCGARGTDTFEFGEKLAHTYDKEVATETYLKSAATCTDRAVYYKSCVCGEKGTETFESGETNPDKHAGTLGGWQSNDDGHWKEYSCCQTKVQEGKHTWNKGEVTTPATCTAAGEKTYTCGTCNAKKTEEIQVTGHAWDTKWSKDNDHHWHKCKNCNAIDASTKAPHSWDNVEVTTPATCTAAGVKTLTCTVCSATKKDTIPATGHTPGAAVCENKVAATCTTAGSYDEVVYCTACGNELSRTQKTIDKLAHDYDTTKWVKADVNQHGHKCKNCDAITDLTAHVPGAVATETTPQLCTKCGYVIAPATHPNHTWVFVAETTATCNAAGEREHYKCTCGRTSFKNDDAYDINEDASVLTIEKNSANHTGAPDSKWHSDSANHWQEYTCCHAKANEAAHSGGAATCTAQAVCQVCGKAYGPLAAHDWGAWKVTTPATKDAPGVETRTCAHNSAHTETRSIPKLSTAVYTVSEDTKIAQIEAKVDGLDKILELNENKALVNDGKSVGVSLTVKNTASSGVSEKIKEKLAGSNLVGLRLELTVEKTVTENGAVVERENIPDTGVLLRTTITLPAELQGKSGYVVYRLHGDAVHVLTETPNENGEFISVSADKTQITICARLYSEYVIAYQTGGSSGGGYHPVNPTPVKATSANTGDAGVLLYGVTAALSLTGTAWLGAKSRKH